MNGNVSSLTSLPYSYILTLPNETFIHILSYLDLHSIIRFDRACGGLENKKFSIEEARDHLKIQHTVNSRWKVCENEKPGSEWERYLSLKFRENLLNCSPSFQFLENFGLLKLQLEKDQEADELFTRALSLNSSPCFEFLGCFALIKLELKKFQEAEELLIKAHSLNSSLGLFDNFDSSKLLLEKYPEAEELFIKVLSLNSPPSFQLFENLGKLKLKLEKHLEAEEFFAKAYSLNSSPSFKFLKNFGSIKLILKKYQEAEKLFTKAHSLNSSPNAGFFANFSLIKLSLKKYQEAENLLSAVIQNKPPSPIFNFIMALIKNNLEKHEEAESHFLQALELFDKEVIESQIPEALQFATLKENKYFFEKQSKCTKCLEILYNKLCT